MGDRTDNGPVLGSGWTQSLSILFLAIGGIVLYATFRDREFRAIGWIAMGLGLIPAAFVAYRFWRLRQALGTADLKFDDPVPLGFSGSAT